MDSQQKISTHWIPTDLPKLRHQFLHRNTKRTGDLLHRIQRRTLLATLDEADVGTVELRFIGKPFLRESLLHADRADSFSKLLD